jgi:GT2 family glycosyltransferase
MSDVAVILCHHQGELIYKCIASLLDSYEVDYKVYVSTSDYELAKRGIEGCIVSYSHHLPAAKRNEIAAFVDEKYLVFMDDDVVIRPDALKILLETVKKKQVGMVFAKLFNAEFTDRLDEAGGYLTQTGFIWSRAEQNIKDEPRLCIEEPIFAGKSALCIIPSKLFWDVGGFDEDFGILGEESDLAWRVWLSGNIVLFKPQAIAYHYFNTKFKPASQYYTSERVQYNGCRNYITMLIKNLGKENLWRIVPIHIAIWSFAGLAMLVTGKLRQGWNILRGIAYTIRNLWSIILKRDEVQKQRIVADKEIFPFIYRKTRWGYYWQRFTRYLRIGLHG